MRRKLFSGQRGTVRPVNLNTFRRISNIRQRLVHQQRSAFRVSRQRADDLAGGSFTGAVGHIGSQLLQLRRLFALLAQRLLQLVGRVNTFDLQAELVAVRRVESLGSFGEFRVCLAVNFKLECHVTLLWITGAVVSLAGDGVNGPQLSQRVRPARRIREPAYRHARPEQLGPLRPEYVILERLVLASQEPVVSQAGVDRPVDTRPLRVEAGDSEVRPDLRYQDAPAVVCYYTVCGVKPVPTLEIVHMARKIDPSHLDHAVEMMRQGKRIPEVCRITGISLSVLYRTAAERGISTARVNVGASLDADSILASYRSGVGCVGIARKLGVSATVIARLLRKLGVHIRNRSEQQQARMDNSTPEQIAHLTRNAHAATKLRKKTDDEIRKMAATRFRNGTVKTSALEEAFDEFMRNRGHNGLRQTPVDKYNADFIFENVAVEIFGGCWHWTGDHLARSKDRIKAFLDSGYHLIIVACRSGGIRPVCADKVISLLNEFRRNESAIRHYRMISSNGDEVIRGSSEGDNLTIEW